MVAVIALWLLFSAGRPTRRTIAVGLLSLVVSLASIGVYVEWRHAASGLSGLTTNGSWTLYGRVAPWADCTKFTPPPRHPGAVRNDAALAAALPQHRRATSSTASPAVELFGPSYFVSKYPHAMARLRQWSQAAILGQPLDYLHAVWLDTIRLVDPNHHSYGHYSANEMIAFMLYGPDLHSGNNAFVAYWQRLLYPARSRHPPGRRRAAEEMGAHHAHRRRVDADPAGAVPRRAVARCAAALGRGWCCSPSPRSSLLFFPILSKGYDYRYVIPAFGPLLAAGALAAWGLVVRVKARVRAARA